jgi:hypothetical protein
MDVCREYDNARFTGAGFRRAANVTPAPCLKCFGTFREPSVAATAMNGASLSVREVMSRRIQEGN